MSDVGSRHRRALGCRASPLWRISFSSDNKPLRSGEGRFRPPDRPGLGEVRAPAPPHFISVIVSQGGKVPAGNADACLELSFGMSGQ